MRFEPNATSPNIIGGHPNNSVSGFYAQTVAGGGTADNKCFDPLSLTFTRSCSNHALSAKATVRGALGNSASGGSATVAGGPSNVANSLESNVAGGYGNVASANFATVAGGYENDVKRDFGAVDVKEVLRQVSRLPIQRWRFMNENASIRHLSPMAQDFRAAFDLGTDDRLSRPPTRTVSQAAIQAPHQVVQEKDAQITALEHRIAQLERAVEALGARQ